jgi:hypothetical protein
MANSNRPFGFRWVGSLADGAVSGKVQKFYTNHATAIFVGDLVKSEGTVGRVNPDDAYFPAVEIAASAAVALGVVVGFEPLPASPTLRYHTASTAQYVLVNVDPMALYCVQGDSTTWTIDDVGTNAAITNTTGDTTTGLSKFVLTGPTESAAASVLIINFEPTPDNAVGAYSRFIVKLNLNQYANAALGIE